jgi:hypothetical protein
MPAASQELEALLGQSSSLAAQSDWTGQSLSTNHPTRLQSETLMLLAGTLMILCG